MKIKAWYLIFALVLSQSVVLSQDTLSKYKIAIFAPLYLDSAFDGVNNYKYAKKRFSKIY